MSGFLSRAFNVSYWAIGLSVLLSLILAWYAHDSLWWPNDDGVFAHWAEQINNGEVWGLGVLGVHGGYHSYFNALLLQWFGTDVVVLRYPLVVLGAVQAGLVTWLLRRQGPFVAVLGGVAGVVVGYLFTPVPSPIWYALFFAVAVCALMARSSRTTSHWMALGFLIGLCFMFRHPNALFIGFGWLAYWLYQSRADGSMVGSLLGSWLARAALVAMVAIVLFYQSFVFEPLAFVVYGFAPLALLVLLFRRSTWSLEWFRPLGWVGLGAGAAVMPMAAYQLWHGNLWGWFSTSFFSSGNTPVLAVFDDFTYAAEIAGLAAALTPDAYIIGVLSIVLWGTFFLYPVVVSGTLLSRVWRGAECSDPIQWVAVMYGLVSFYFQIPFYLAGSLPLFILAFLRLLPPHGIVRVLGIGAVCFTVGWSLLTTVPGTAWGITGKAVGETPIPRVSLVYEKINEPLADVFRTVEALSEPDDAIFVYPLDAHIYFSTGRSNPFPFPGTSLFVTDDADLDAVQRQLLEVPVALIVFNAANDYRGPIEAELTEWIESRPEYRFEREVAGHRFYVRVE